MTLIVIVVALALELFAERRSGAREWQWLSAYADWFQRRLSGWRYGDGAIGLLIVLLPLVLLAVLLQSAVHSIWLGAFALLLGVVVLYYCLRYRAVDGIVDKYCDALEAGDRERAEAAAAELRVRNVHGETLGARSVAETILIQANERLFSVLFWFVLLGPAGAVLYRVTWFLSERQSGDGGVDAPFALAARRLQGILGWVPARLTVICYGLAGNFEEAIHDWRMSADRASADIADNNEDVLRSAGAGALQLERFAARTAAQNGGGDEDLEPAAVKSARGLVLRSLMIWVTAIAVVTLAGWAY